MLDIVITNMNAGPVQLYQTGMLVGATVKDMAHDWIQLLQTWLMVGYKCNLHGCR